MEFKICKVCLKEKPLTDFDAPLGKRKFTKWVWYICKECQYNKKSETQKKYRELHPYNYKEDKNRKLRKRYWIWIQDYDSMLKFQNYKCAICWAEDISKRRAFAIDHCHNTWKIRWLLCSNCNTWIGNLKDDIDLLQKAITYLQQYL